MSRSLRFITNHKKAGTCSSSFRACFLPVNAYICVAMKLDATILDALTAAAKTSPRLRMNYDLRTTPADNSQRMLNALEPGTVLPIHRHLATNEVVAILRGSAVQYFYDDSGALTESVTIKAGSDCTAMIVEKGRWHRLESLESGTVILECKDGAYQPISPDELFDSAAR